MKYDAFDTGNDEANKKKFIVSFPYPYYKEILTENEKYYYDYFLNGTVTSTDIRYPENPKYGIYEENGDANIKGLDNKIFFNYTENKGYGTYYA